MRRLLLCALVASAVAPLELPAQQLREQLRLAQTYSWYVRATLGPYDIASGRVRALTQDAVRIDTAMIKLSEVTMLERRATEGGGWRQGAIAGTVVMAVLFAGTQEAFGESKTEPVMLLIGSVFLGALIGVPVGGLIGGIVNPATEVWKPVWPAAK